MIGLHDRIAALESALQEQHEVDFPDPPPRRSLDHRFDKTHPSVDAAPVPTPAQEKANLLESINRDSGKSQYYDSIAATFGLGIRDEDDSTDYVVYNAFVTNLRVCPVHLTESGHYYYIEHRAFLQNVPGVVLRQGSDKEGKSLGVAHLPFQGHSSIGVGDIENRPHDMVWDSMGKTTFWTHQRYRFEHELPSGEKKAFNWIRTRNNVIDDQGDLVLIEEGKESDVLAEYVGQGVLKWKKRGKLRIRNMETDWGQTWELIVLLTWSSVIELSRHRARVRRYSPTHLIGI